MRLVESIFKNINESENLGGDLDIKITLDKRLLDDADLDFFHYDYSYQLATCKYGTFHIASRGELRCEYIDEEKGIETRNYDDIIHYYVKNNQEYREAVDSGKLIIYDNNWFEIELLLDANLINYHEGYVDFPDIYGSISDAYESFQEDMSSPEMIDWLKEEIGDNITHANIGTGLAESNYGDINPEEISPDAYLHIEGDDGNKYVRAGIGDHTSLGGGNYSRYPEGEVSRLYNEVKSKAKSKGVKVSDKLKKAGAAAYDEIIPRYNADNEQDIKDLEPYKDRPLKRRELDDIIEITGRRDASGDSDRQKKYRGTGEYGKLHSKINDLKRLSADLDSNGFGELKKIHINESLDLKKDDDFELKKDFLYDMYEKIKERYDAVEWQSDLYAEVDFKELPGMLVLVLENIDGDWKHEHMLLNACIREATDPVDITENIVEEDGSDWYAADHNVFYSMSQFEEYKKNHNK